MMAIVHAHVLKLTNYAQNCAYAATVIFAMMFKRKYYNVTFKLGVVNCVEKELKEATAKDFGVDTKRIRV